MNIELLERLCTACGVSGDEDDIRDIILEEIKPYADELKVDSLGNILAFKKGKQRAKSKLLISAHMDEVGFIVTNIESNGTLKFAEVGGIDKKAACGKAVLIGKNKLPGVIGAVPVHVLKADERAKNPSIDSLYIDIGADTKEQAEKCVSLGDCVYFDSVFEADERIIGKAIDDRAGCMALIELLQSELEYDTYFSFVVQEEIGLRGAKGAAFTLNPDTAIVVEATTASDIPDVSGADKVCSVGSGAVVSFMDGATMYDRTLYRLIIDNAKQAEIPVQTKTKIAGGNDAGAIHQSRGGVRTAAISVPCRYLHSSTSLISRDDLQAVCDTLRLAAELAAGNDFTC